MKHFMIAWDEKGALMNWKKLEVDSKPILKRCMLLQIEDDKGFPSCVVVGYFKRFSNDELYWVHPGVSLENPNREVTHYSDSLGDNFHCPGWENKSMNKD